MVVVPQTDDVLSVLDDGSVTGPAHLVLPYSVQVMARSAGHRIKATTSAEQVARIAKGDSCSFIGHGARVRRRMRKIAHELEAYGYTSKMAGSDDVSVLMVSATRPQPGRGRTSDRPPSTG